MKPQGVFLPLLLLGLSACQTLPQEIQIRLISPSSTPFPTLRPTAKPVAESRVVRITPAPEIPASPAASVPASVPVSVPAASASDPPGPLPPAPLAGPAPLPELGPAPVSVAPQPADRPPQPSTSPSVLPPSPTPTNLPTNLPTPLQPSSQPTPHPTPTPTPRPPYLPPSSTAVSYSNSLGMHFRKLPAGTFFMGSAPTETGRKDDETQHEVSLAEFWIQSTEVTQGQWLAVMGYNPAYFPINPENPVEMVSWHDAARFVSHLNSRGEGRYRLPSEAEWEYAARAGSGSAYACGEIGSACLANMAWFIENTGGTRSQAVASKSPNAWGLYDFHGNVSEWVNDWYGPYAERPSSNPLDRLLALSRSTVAAVGGGKLSACGRHNARPTTPTPSAPNWAFGSCLNPEQGSH